MDTHAERRDAKQAKRRFGMRVNNKRALLLQAIINRRAKEAHDARTHGHDPRGR